jgi:hypothetical protein
MITLATIRDDIAALERELSPDQVGRLRAIVTTAEQMAVVQVTQLVNSRLDMVTIGGFKVGKLIEGYADSLIKKGASDFVSVLGLAQ